MKTSEDKFGPEYVVEVYDPKIGMRGFLVIDNLTLGPGKGGIRMTSNLTVDEVFRLARTMTWKNSLAGIPFGGAKAGIVWDGGDEKLKKSFVQSFARKIKFFVPGLYIAGPDVNTGEKEMQWFVEAAGSRKTATGKPKKLGGLPHELGSTGFGVAKAAVIAAELKGINLKNATVAIDGFGNVGSFAFKFLNKAGAKIVAVADSRSTAFSEKGLDFSKIVKLKSRGGPVGDYLGAKKLAREKIFGLKVDILIPASVTDVINDKNKRAVKAKIIVEGANIPMREDIENELSRRGILIVPDFVANAGGVISSYAEYRGYGPKKMFEMVEQKITDSVRLVLGSSLKLKKSPREAALALARKRVESKVRL